MMIQWAWVFFTIESEEEVKNVAIWTAFRAELIEKKVPLPAAE